MKARNLTVLAVVATGALALAAPSAMAADAQVSKKKSSFQKKTEKDLKSVKKSIKSLKNEDKKDGQRVVDLQKTVAANDKKVDVIAASAIENLTALKDGLTTLGETYKDFEYGTVQLYAGSDLIAGAFAATPRLDPTLEQSTVTAQFPCLPTAAGGKCDPGDVINAKVALRSANPTTNAEKYSYSCRVQVGQGGRWAITLKGTSPFLAVSELSPLTPEDPKTENTFPAAPASSDKQTNMFAATTSINSNVALNNASSVGGFEAQQGLFDGANEGKGMLEVTLSCLRAPK